MPKSPPKIHVFAGQFTSRDEACSYTEQQWEPEPDESATDDVYEQWEQRNPTWGLSDDLEIGLDPDFIETIDGKNRFKYLSGYLINDHDINAIQESADSTNILVLIFADAVHDRNAEFRSTSKLKYCGSFDFTWNKTR